MLIEVWSDVVCPWCYIGKRRLDKAIAMFDHRDQVTVMHRAFQLQPDAQGVHPTKQHLAEKYGVSEAQVEQMQQNVCDIATGEGLCYDLSNTVSGNTKDAHRLLLWAADSGKQDELLKAMYAGYFEQGKSLFTHDDLLALVVDAGLDRDAAADVLNSTKYADTVTDDQTTAHAFGANGVPFFVFDRKYGISGAQPLEAFTQTLQAAWADAQ